MNNNIHITAVEPSGNLYGSEHCLLDILRNTSRDKFQWSVITTRGPFFELLQREGIAKPPIPCLEPNLHLKSRILKTPSYIRLFYKLALLRPDLIYVNQSGILRVTHLIANILKIPIVCQVQTLEDAESFHQNHTNFPMVRSFICNSDFIANKTQIDDSRKSILYQGVLPPENTTKPKSSHPSSDSLRLGILGRIGKSKGHYLLADAVKLLSSCGKPFSVRVIGDGISPSATEHWVNYLKSNQILQFFDLRGYQSNLKEELSFVDLLLIPSLAEPLGRVLFDAAIHQTPVVVSNAGGLGEIASRFQVGIPFQSCDAASLVDSILKFDGSRETETKKFNTNALRMLKSLSIKSYISRIESILTKASKQENSCLNWYGDS